MQRFIKLLALSFFITFVFLSCNVYQKITHNQLISIGVSNNGNDDDWLIKTFDQYGKEDTSNWNKLLEGGNNGDDTAYSIAIDSINNVYIVGSMYNGTDDDWWIKKYDSDGNEITTNWNKTFDGGSNGNDFAYSVAVDSINSVYVVGSNYNGTNDDWWIIKYLHDGTEAWSKIYNGENNGNDIAHGIEIDDNNDVYVVGSKNYGINNDDWWIKKHTSGGTEDTSNWNKSFDGGSNGNDIAYSVQIDKYNNVYVVGSKNYGINGDDWWIKKYNSNGNEDTMLWNKSFDGEFKGNDIAYDVVIDTNNNVYVVGSMYNGNNLDWWLKKYNPNGNEDTRNWDKIINGTNSDDRALFIDIFY
jgi:uncharacterized delta-60 repeat protein